jgi:LysM repeat protein
MHYLAKHAATKRRSLKARFAGIGVAGAATIVGGVVTATEAKAAGGTIWDAVAQCETGQNWATRSVPGYSGGLGFAHQYWGAFGGTQFAALPYQATREQQIIVAQRILAVNGPNAWPVCGPRAGLTKANGGAASAAPAAAPSTSRSTTRTAPKATTTTTTKRATTTPKATKPANAAPTVSGKNVTVKAGDTLSELAQALGVKGGWQALYQANTSIVKNPNLIYVGQVLNLPA